jgi:neutral ceramidase
MRAHLLVLGAVAACGGGDGPAVPDGGGVTTASCDYLDVAPTSNASGTVAAGPLEAGAAEIVLDVPVGTALGGYTARAHAQGGQSPDARDRRISEGFEPSFGIETAPRAKAIALTAGGETIVIVKLDAIFAYEAMLFELEDRLGAGFHGKVLLATSHSHSAWMQFTGHDALQVGGGEQRDLVYQRMLDGAEAAARAALAARRPAAIGFFDDSNFDREDADNRDRRGENDILPGGAEPGDTYLSLIRIDGTDGAPIAVIPIFGEHGTLMGDDNPLASTDAPGAVERAVEESLFGNGAVVVHLQGAGADTSPVGHGSIDCAVSPGGTDDPCLGLAALEGHGRAAADALREAWTDAGTAMATQLELEMLTRSVELGPSPETFTIRDGALGYAPFDTVRVADGVVYDGTGDVISPIDEFNAPVGAALCEGDTALFPAAQIPGTDGLLTYGSCVRLDKAAEVIGPLLDLDMEVTATSPVCETTRTTISTVRIGDHVIGTLPGELSVLLAGLVRAGSPVDAAHTIVVGYAQGHVGYLLRPEDWLLGGYEPSITFWGPLEAEYLAEQLVALMPLAMTAAREDGAADGTDRVATDHHDDELTIDTDAPLRGTVPETVPATVWLRGGVPATAQPAAQVPRVSGLATFVWIGDDPTERTPVVTLERETAPGVFAPMLRRSGREIRDGDFLLTYPPDPLNDDGSPQQHLWAVEFQAVPPLGTLDDLDQRAGLPLARYRFHVVGDDWTLDSAPFEVVPGGLGVTASRAGTVVTATVTLEAPDGFRLLDLELPSNRPVPARTQPVTWELLDGTGGALATGSADSSATGELAIDDAAVPTAVTVRVTDRFGNSAIATL